MPIILPSGGGGSGGSQTYAARCLYTGNPVTVADGGATGILTWDSIGSGTEQLDRGDPANPTILVSGIYAVTVTLDSTEILSAGGMCFAALHMDADNEDAVCEMTSNDDKPATFQILVSMNQSYYVPAGGVLRVTVINYDGVSARPYRLREASVQRLS